MDPPISTLFPWSQTAAPGACATSLADAPAAAAPGAARSAESAAFWSVQPYSYKVVPHN